MPKMTWCVKVTVRGSNSVSITVPKKLSEALGLKVGDRVDCTLLGEDGILIKKTKEEQE